MIRYIPLVTWIFLVYTLTYGGLSLSLEICQRLYEKTFQLNRIFNKNVKQKLTNT